MTTPTSWTVTYTDTTGQRQRATGLADYDAAAERRRELIARGCRFAKTHPQFDSLRGAVAYANRNNAPAPEADDDWAEMAADEQADSLFIPELDGNTFASRRDLADYHDYLSEADAENGWLRAAENNDRYAWEDEQDRLRAAAFGDFAAAFGAF